MQPGQDARSAHAQVQRAVDPVTTIGVDAPGGSDAAAGERPFRGVGRICDEGSLFINPDDGSPWRDKWAQGEIGQVRRVLIEVRDHAKIRDEAQPLLAAFARMTEARDVPAESHRAGTASGDGCALSPGTPDGIPDSGPTEGLGQVRGIPAGEIDKSSPGDGIDVVRVIGICPGPDIDDHLLDTESLRGSGAQRVPPIKDPVTFGRGGRGQLHEAWRTILDQPCLDGLHDREVLATADEGDPAR